MFYTLITAMRSRKSTANIIALVLVCLTGVLIYSNTFQSPFAFDDRTSIVENDAIKNITNLQAIWKFDPTHLIPYLSLAANFHFHQLRVFGYHLINLIVHILTALLVWRLISLTFNTPVLKDKEIARHGWWLSLGGALLFVSHPVQTEAVTYIVQRGTSLAALFYLGSLVSYIKARLSVQTKSSSAVWKTYYGLSLLSAVLGMFSKQIVFTLPLMIVLYEFCFLKRAEDKNVSWKYWAPFLILLLIVPWNVAAAKKSTIWQITELTKESAIISRGQYLLTEFRVLVTYLRLLFVPLNQNLDYDYPVSQNLLAWPVLASLSLLILILTAGLLLFCKYRLISFAIFWFFLTLSIESSFIPIRDVIFEHRLYLPMLSYSLFIPAVIYYLYANKHAKSGVIILLALVCSYSFLTYRRNNVWRDELTLWTDTVNKSPQKARPLFNIGTVHLKKTDYEKALNYFNQAIKINPLDGKTYNNRGLAYKEKGEYDKALLDFNESIKIDSGDAVAYNNRGFIYLLQENYDKALLDFNESIKIDSGNAEAYNNRGSIYLFKENYEKALADFNRATTIAPTKLAEGYNNRGLVYKNQKDYKKAVLEFNEAINRGYMEAYNNRGVVFLETGEYDKAISDFNYILKIKPDYVTVYYNRALCYFFLKQYKNAWSDVRKMQELDCQVNLKFLQQLRDISPE